MAKKSSKAMKRSPSKRRVNQQTIAEIQDQLRIRDREVKNLQHKRAKLIDEVERLEQAIYTLSGEPAKGSRRPRNEFNLGDALVNVLRGKEMSVTDATKAVQMAGYQTTASNFRTIVNQRLIADKRIRKVRQGVYTTKKRYT